MKIAVCPIITPGRPIPTPDLWPTFTTIGMKPTFPGNRDSSKVTVYVPGEQPNIALNARVQDNEFSWRKEKETLFVKDAGEIAVKMDNGEAITLPQVAA